ncbi:MAG: RloB family protein [Lachnospiraceae bacterium]
MGTDDLFKKRRQARKQRKYEYKTPKANSFLIVTEGTCTEPLYFKGLQKLILEKVGGIVDVVEKPMIQIQGHGCSTSKLLEVTDQIVKDAKIIYQNVWLVFDKDDFDDFDQAIQAAEAKGYHVAWSNQAFEYWLYLHFNYSDVALHRSQWNQRLDTEFQKFNLGNGRYQKKLREYI